MSKTKRKRAFADKAEPDNKWEEKHYRRESRETRQIFWCCSRILDEFIVAL